MLNNSMPKSEVVIACDPNAVPAEEREQWVHAGKQVYAAVQEVRETADGYAFRLPAETTMLMKLAEYMSNERLCCAFLRFNLEIEPGGGPFWLRLTGGEGVKEYMHAVFDENDLLDEAVVRAAGLRK